MIGPRQLHMTKFAFSRLFGYLVTTTGGQLFPAQVQEMGNAAVTGGKDSREHDDSREDVYVGGMKGDLFDGKGRLVYGSADPRHRDVYDGSWLGGKRHGQGNLKWRNGAWYQGNWEDDLLHGVGVLVLPSGLRYEGEFRNNQFEGQGVLEYTNGKRFEGLWKENRHEGYGKLTYSPEDSRKRKEYVGQWRKGKRHGHGCMVWTNGAMYEGSWVDGKRDGYGKHTFPSGQVRTLFTLHPAYLACRHLRGIACFCLPVVVL